MEEAELQGEVQGPKVCAEDARAPGTAVVQYLLGD